VTELASKPIMILGAGVYQVPLIREVKKAGHTAIVVSPGGDYPGICLADVFLELDITDIGAVTDSAREQGVIGIVTAGSDVGVPTIGTVAESLGLKGPTRNASETVSSKIGFRTFLQKNGLNCPNFAACRSAEDAISFCDSWDNGKVLKPDDSSGSRGVTILEAGAGTDMIEEAYRHAAQHSRSGLVCAEEFLAGMEVGGDAFFIDGTLGFFTTTCKHMEGTLVRGHSLPGSLPRHQVTQVKNEIYRIASRLGYRDGPINFDVMVAENGATAIEVGLRNGGNGIVDLIRCSEGVNLHRWLISYVLGVPISAEQEEKPRAVSSFVFGSPGAGILRHVPETTDLRRNVPEVLDVVLARNAGDRVEAFQHNASLIGYLLLDCGFADYAEVTARAQQALELEIECG